MEEPIWGIEIRGSVCRADRQLLDHDEFLEAFIAFVEANGWQFGGTTRAVNLNADEDVVLGAGVQRKHKEDI